MEKSGMTVTRGTLGIPEPIHAIEDTTTDEIDTSLDVLHHHRQHWIDTDIERRIELVRSMRKLVAAIAEEWVDAVCNAKGVERGTPAEGENWQSGPWITLRNLRLLERSLTDLASGRKPKLPGKIRPNKMNKARKGHTKVPNFPTDLWDRLVFPGFKGETWMQQGIDAADVVDRQAMAFDPGTPPDPDLCVVLGAGNVSSIAPTDTLYKLFVELKPVMLKVNPVVEYMGPIIEKCFAPLIDANVLRLSYGGADVGKYLTTHDLVDSIHMTGSDKTFEAIMFGSGPEAAERKARGEVINHRNFTSELGNVTPVIVVPGPWKDSDFDYQAQSLASMLTNNAGFNCIATRVLIQHASWEHRDRLLDSLTAAFAGIETRAAYYPGAVSRFEQFTDAHPEAERIGLRSDEALPWTLIRDVPTDDPNDVCFATESLRVDRL